MITLDIHFEDGQVVCNQYALPLLVGRGADCGLQLKHWRIAKNHFLLRRGVDGVYIEDLGSLMGTRVNGHRITRYGPLRELDTCIVGPCKLHISNAQSIAATQKSAVIPVVVIPEETVKSFDAQTSVVEESTIALISTDNEVMPVSFEESDVELDTNPLEARYFEIRKALHSSLIQALDLRRHDVSSLSDIALRQEAEKCVAELLADYPEIDSELKRKKLITLVSDEAIGLGVLESLLADPGISEIMVNRFDLIYVERGGKIQPHAAVFSSEMALRSVIDRIVFPLGRRIDESSPMVDARLKDGSRINAVIAPIAIHGSCLTIRKFSDKTLSMSDLVKRDSIDLLMAELFQICINLRLNIIVSGGTGSGKTTLLNILAQAVAPEQRIVTIEDSAELRINHPHVLSLESRPANAEGSGQISIRDLVRNAMRMRPDRIIVGEVRGAEAIDMLVAMNTGHEGSLTTLHANSPRDALARIETLVLMANLGLPLKAIREQLASAVNIIVQQTRLTCGRRLVTSVAEITGTESGVIQLQTLVSFDPESQSFKKNSLPPVFFQRLNSQSDDFVQSWFNHS